jgi:hypothetical protein
MKKIWGKSTIIFQERKLKAVKRIVNLSKGFGNKKEAVS